MFQNIVNPRSGKVHSLYSRSGQKILNKYLKTYQQGGNLLNLQDQEGGEAKYKLNERSEFGVGPRTVGGEIEPLDWVEGKEELFYRFPLYEKECEKLQKVLPELVQSDRNVMSKYPDQRVKTSREFIEKPYVEHDKCWDNSDAAKIRLYQTILDYAVYSSKNKEELEMFINSKFIKPSPNGLGMCPPRDYFPNYYPPEKWEMLENFFPNYRKKKEDSTDTDNEYPLNNLLFSVTISADRKNNALYKWVNDNKRIFPNNEKINASFFFNTGTKNLSIFVNTLQDIIDVKRGEAFGDTISNALVVAKENKSDESTTDENTLLIVSSVNDLIKSSETAVANNLVEQLKPTTQVEIGGDHSYISEEELKRIATDFFNRMACEDANCSTKDIYKSLIKGGEVKCMCTVDGVLVEHTKNMGVLLNLCNEGETCRGQEMGQTKLQVLVNSLDTDGDGKVNLKEWLIGVLPIMKQNIGIYMPIQVANSTDLENNRLTETAKLQGKIKTIEPESEKEIERTKNPSNYVISPYKLLETTIIEDGLSAKYSGEVDGTTDIQPSNISNALVLVSSNVQESIPQQEQQTPMVPKLTEEQLKLNKKVFDDIVLKLKGSDEDKQVAASSALVIYNKGTNNNNAKSIRDDVKGVNDETSLLEKIDTDINNFLSIGVDDTIRERVKEKWQNITKKHFEETKEKDSNLFQQSLQQYVSKEDSLKQISSIIQSEKEDVKDLLKRTINFKKKDGTETPLTIESTLNMYGMREEIESNNLKLLRENINDKLENIGDHIDLNKRLLTDVDEDTSKKVLKQMNNDFKNMVKTSNTLSAVKDNKVLVLGKEITTDDVNEFKKYYCISKFCQQDDPLEKMEKCINASPPKSEMNARGKEVWKITDKDGNKKKVINKNNPSITLDDCLKNKSCIKNEDDCDED